MNTRTPKNYSEHSLDYYNLDQLLVMLKMQRDQLTAINENEFRPTTENEMREKLGASTRAIIAEINQRLSRYEATISFNTVPHHVETFMFSYLNPLDQAPVRDIVGCELIGDFIHFQMIDGAGKKGMRKLTKCDYLMKQIEQHRISIEAKQ